MTDENEGYAYITAGDKRYTLSAPLKRYIVLYTDYTDVIQASSMTTTDTGVIFENCVIRGKNGVPIGMGRTFIEHWAVVGVTLVEQEFGKVTIDNDTLISLFGINQPDDTPDKTIEDINKITMALK